MSTFKELTENKAILNSKLYLKLAVISVVIAVILAIVILFFIKDLPTTMPLFYSLTWGEAQLANHNQFLILPAVIILVTLINLSLSWYLHQSQDFLKKALMITSLIITLILLVTFFKIVTIFI